MTAHEANALSALDAAGVGVRVEFVRSSCRWAHRVDVVIGQQCVAVLESCEGNDAQACPPSPPLQQLAFQDLGDGRRAAMLVGMAGRNHWSLSVVSYAQQRRICFDAACRCSSTEAVALGSAYRVLAPGAVAVSDTGLSGTLAGRRFALLPGRLESASPGAIVGGDPQLIRVSPVVAGQAVTARWCYDVVVDFEFSETG